MEQGKMKALAGELAKGIKTEKDLGELSGQLMKLVVETALGAGMEAHPGFTAKFAEELGHREVRVPITLNPKLFKNALQLGRELLFLHTYGERFANGQSWPKPMVKCHTPVPGPGLPEKFSYHEDRQVINIGGGEFGPVSPSVWKFEVSGLKIVQSWLGYRMLKRKGKSSSPLDDIRPAEWSSEFTTELLKLLNLLTRTLENYPSQAELLDEILAGELLTADALGDVPEQYRKAPKQKAGQARLAF